MPGIDQSYVGGRNPFVSLAGMFFRLVPPRWMVGIGAANVKNCRDLLWIFADQFIGIVLAAEPQVVDDAVHHSGSVWKPPRRFQFISICIQYISRSFVYM